MKSIRRWTRYMPAAAFSLFLLVMVVFLWKQAMNILMLILIAAVIAYLITPLCRLYERRLSSSWAAVASFATVIAALAILMLLAIPAIYKQISYIVTKMPEYGEQLMRAWESLLAWLHNIGLSESVIATLESQSSILLDELANAIRTWLMRFGDGVVSNSWLALAPVASYYLVRDRVKVFDRMLHLAPMRVRPAVMRWALEIREVLGDYIRGQLIIALIVGVATSLGLMIIGVEGYLVLGVLMAILNMIPYLGPILGMVPIVSLAAVQGKVVAAFLIAFAVQQLESAFVAPRIMSDTTGVHPVIVIIVLTVGGSLSGAGGMLIALPAYLVLRVTAKAVYRGLTVEGETGEPQEDGRGGYARTEGMGDREARERAQGEARGERREDTRDEIPCGDRRGSGEPQRES